MICVFYFMMGAPEGSTEKGFMGKPGIEHVTPGLQDIGLSPTPWWLLRKKYLDHFIENLTGNPIKYKMDNSILINMHWVIQNKKVTDPMKVTSCIKIQCR